MANAFDTLVKRLFADRNLSVPASYTPVGGPAQSVRVVFSEPDATVSSFSNSRVSTGRASADIEVSKVPVKPGRGCTLEVNGVVYNVGSSSQEKGGRIWRMVLTNA